MGPRDTSGGLNMAFGESHHGTTQSKVLESKFTVCRSYSNGNKVEMHAMHAMHDNTCILSSFASLAS